jgi:hypothetical protein
VASTMAYSISGWSEQASHGEDQVKGVVRIRVTSADLQYLFDIQV